MAATTPDSQQGTAPAALAVGQGGIETHGIDHIPEGERHGRARELFGVWAAPNVSYLNLVVGGALILMGLSLWQSLAVIVAGNLCWALVGLLAVSGPAAGTPSEVITRAVFGIRGNRATVVLTGWFVSVCYLALNWAAGSLAAFALAAEAGITPGTPLKVVIIVAVAVATLAISVYGHATILRLYLPFTLVLTAVFTVLGGYVVARADWSYRPEQPLHGAALWAALAGGTALIASAPLSYNNSADFSRYLPTATSRWAVASWTAVGAFLPSVLFTALGAVAGTALDMTDPQAALVAVLPSWFRPLFLLAVVLGAIANNAMTAYSSGLALQAFGLRVRRSLSVALDGTLGIALTLYALLVSNFLDTVDNMLQLMVALLGPSMAVYAADILRRRNRYDGPALCDESATSPYWYRAGVHWPGITALAVGTVAATLCLATPDFTGPIAAALGGTDLSLPVGTLTAAALYLALGPRRPGTR
ncbi:nitrate reductase [Kitasatospora sp. MMS16-BH015]|uniref:purine-cytosine permease family protein n=1 Tax=Kitasatospora sp. MMS16-BH015 TaxID=2018025 RepID=UPI000CA0BAA7|nr:cytosine permease [Kitasatospora sp. MMS16-BH015]AUG76667.1 nitrate reductase [Kitasatospora sp. MMS16-BH015]